jgi:3D (Asp-Asp-Asp) domain-containing protein
MNQKSFLVHFLKELGSFIVRAPFIFPTVVFISFLLITIPLFPLNATRTLSLELTKDHKTGLQAVQAELVFNSEVWEVVETRKAVITAYSSTVDQTDDTPFLTAAQTSVRDGIVAVNWLPIGTRIRIPEAFGNKVFIVEDRMHPRYKERVDIWMTHRHEASAWGKRKLYVEVLSPKNKIYKKVD